VAATENVSGIEIALLTGGADRPYAFGLIKALTPQIAFLEVIGNDELDCPELHDSPNVKFLNLRGDQRSDADFISKTLRVLKYYVRLIRYSASAEPRIFHILWNNKFEYFDRTLLMLWYRALGKKIVLTLHNVNGRKRDRNDSALNRLTLRIQYGLAELAFVHTEKMKQELMEEFAFPAKKVTVIPFGINNSVPDTLITGKQAREKLGIADEEKAILFFGNIAPYKGLDCLVKAFRSLTAVNRSYKLIIAGRPKNCTEYWEELQREMSQDLADGRILLRNEYIPDEDTELYMKAADVLVLPYRYIYQSGVLFLGYSFGLPVLVSDVGSLRDDVVEGRTGFVFQPENPEELSRSIDRYFSSDLYAELAERRPEIRDYALARNSWDVVARLTMDAYSRLTMNRSGKIDTKADSISTADARQN
jgi:glycosyltransferase involved in cell wall biosynthesis